MNKERHKRKQNNTQKYKDLSTTNSIKNRVTISYTDHQAISLKINHKAESRGRGYFKLNSKILENEEYKEIIKQLISKYQKKLVIQKTDPRTLWDVFKAEVRDVTVKICKQISHEKKL